MEPIRIEGPNQVEREGASRRVSPHEDGHVDFEEVLREVGQDLDQLERLTEETRRAASDEGPADPEAFREAVRESEAALRSARRIRSRLLGAYRATQETRP